MFHFKKFSISHSQSTMKIGTDAVLLGAWLPLPDNCLNILEIGCGCGVISLMLAQRTNAKITGIDIDKKSVEEAQKNAENTIWKKNMQFIHEKVQIFAQKNLEKFDIIVSNPPFFENSLKSPKKNNNISKHNDLLPFEELIAAVGILLADNGRFGVILPFESAEKFEKLALLSRLFVTNKKYIYPTPAKKANRILLLFERKDATYVEDKLVIRDKGYTNEYCQFVKNYLSITN